MRTTSFRILKSGILVAGSLFLFGFLFGQIAGTWVTSQTPARSGPVDRSLAELNQTQDSLAEGLQWRMPFAMAAWGFAIVAGYEFLAGIWRQPKLKNANTNHDDLKQSEAQVQEFLRNAEANATNLADTPAPAKLAVQQPAIV